MANQGDVRKVDNEIAKKEEKLPSNYQEVMDAKTRALEDKAIAANKRDKGERFGKGGTTQQRINKQDTKHGKLDLPVANLNRMAGMKGGGSVKKFAGGGDVESLDSSQTFKEAFREARKEGAGTFTWRGEKFSTALDKGKPKSSDNSGERGIGNYKAAPAEAKAPVSGDTAGGAQAGRVSPLSRKMPSDAEKEASSERMGDVVGAASTVIPAGAAAGAAYKGMRGAMAAKKVLDRGALPKSTYDGSKAAQQKMSDMVAKYGAEKDAARAAAREETRKKMEENVAEMAYKKGGSVEKESKGMMKKEVNFFKKKGAPKAMIKHEEAEMKTAKFAKGGGVESRGKTKGTVIKMAAGGAVKGFARGGGIESRGKTNCKTY